MKPISILIHLDQDLQLMQAEFSDAGQLMAINPLLEVWREHKTLNLAGRFESIWQELTQKISRSKLDKIYFLVGPKAGFTDTRIVYIWLRSNQMFNSTPFLVHHIPNPIDLQKLSRVLVDDIIRQASQSCNTDIRYSAAPRLG